MAPLRGAAAVSAGFQAGILGGMVAPVAGGEAIAACKNENVQTAAREIWLAIGVCAAPGISPQNPPSVQRFEDAQRVQQIIGGHELKPERLEESYSPPDAECFGVALSCFQKGNARKAAELAKELVQRGYQPAHFLLGMIYEFGGDQVAIELSKAVSHYRKAAYVARSSVTSIYLARALMKQGWGSYPSALKCLEDAREEHHTPELSLGFAKYHETAPSPDYNLARKYYLKAAMSGRFAGFFGYSAVSRKLGHKGKAFAADCIRVTLGPLLFLVLGRTARKEF